MKKTRAILIALLSPLLLFLAGPAQAVTYYWENTRINYGAIKVQWCAGGTATLYEDDYTSKNVCSAWLAPDHNLFIYVEETGTVLLDADNCNTTGRWITLDSSRDTSRTANITGTSIGCV